MGHVEALRMFEVKASAATEQRDGLIGMAAETQDLRKSLLETLRVAEDVRSKLLEAGGDIEHVRDRGMPAVPEDGFVASAASRTQRLVTSADDLRARLLEVERLLAESGPQEGVGGTEESSEVRELLSVAEELRGRLSEVERLMAQSNGSAAAESQDSGSGTDPAAATGAESTAVSAEVERLRTENSELLARCKQQEEELAAARSALEANATVARIGSEGRLRSALCARGTRATDLRQAISGVEGLLEEARRELASVQLRERRAAAERLHHAMEQDDEGVLEAAIDDAQSAQVEGDDVSRAVAKLSELRALTSEQKAARQAQQEESRRKKDAFVLVKKDDEVGLRELLEGLGESVRWRNWHDYAGRTLWRCSQELRSFRVQRLLASLLGLPAPDVQEDGTLTARARRGSFGGASEQDGAQTARGHDAQATFTSGAMVRQVSGGSAKAVPSAGPEPAPSPEVESPQIVVDAVPPSPGGTSVPSSPGALASPDAHTELRVKAMRAVAHDDLDSLLEVLRCVTTDVWSQWENRAGKDLLTLSQERGCTNAYSLLAKELGLLRERHRDSFEERESVWVFEVGDVQPKRATVLEDTPQHADAILVEFWDGDADATYVERCLVRKMWG